MRVARRHRVGLVCLLLAGLIGVAALVDHRIKTARLNRSELAEWYCTHRHARGECPSSSHIEADWNQRQLAYEFGFATFGGLGLAHILVTVIAARRDGRRRRA